MYGDCVKKKKVEINSLVLLHLLEGRRNEVICSVASGNPRLLRRWNSKIKKM